jgi:hypothetical protein
MRKLRTISLARVLLVLMASATSKIPTIIRTWSLAGFPPNHVVSAGRALRKPSSTMS